MRFRKALARISGNPAALLLLRIYSNSAGVPTGMGATGQYIRFPGERCRRLISNWTVNGRLGIRQVQVGWQIADIFNNRASWMLVMRTSISVGLFWVIRSFVMSTDTPHRVTPLLIS